MSTPSSGNRLPSAVGRGGTGATSTPANQGGGLTSTVTGGGRRSSGSTGTGTGSGGLFSGLINQKRNSSDGIAEARRLSFNDQKPPPGFFGQMWHNFTKGASAK